ncbi:MAG: hypothetical protein ACRC1D_04575 [Culicoidibacterales bacterium]
MLSIKPEHYNIFIGLAVVLVLIIIYVTYQNHQCGEYLYGMWIADEDFCNESDLTGFMMMIGPSSGWLTEQRTMYIVMYNDEGTLCNRTVNVQLGTSFIPGTYQNRSLYILEEDFEIMPREMVLSMSIMNGHMILYGTGEDSETIYGSMYKDHDSTHKALALETAE